MLFRKPVTPVILAVFVLLSFPTVLPAQDTSVEIISVDEDPFKTEEETGPVPVNRILAVVGEQVLTMDEYQTRYGDTRLSQRRLRPLVNQMLLEKAASDREVSLSESRVDRLVNRQVDRMSRAPGGLDRVLRREGLTESEYRGQLRRRLKKQGLESRLLPEFFPGLDNSDTRPASVSVRARLMLVDDVASAWRIYGWLNDQPSERTWNRLFDEYSRRMGLMGKYGDLGWFQWGHFNSKVEYRIFTLPLYAVSEPFPLQDGYALVYPTGYRFTPNESPGSTARKAYRRYQRRYYREQLYDRLREDYPVSYPSSVRRQLGMN